MVCFCRTARVLPAADMFAFGVLAWRVLCGVKPFEDDAAARDKYPPQIVWEGDTHFSVDKWLGIWVYLSCLANKLCGCLFLS